MVIKVTSNDEPIRKMRVGYVPTGALFGSIKHPYLKVSTGAVALPTGEYYDAAKIVTWDPVEVLDPSIKFEIHN